jgi:predicted AAA+ superfamily ATPase
VAVPRLLAPVLQRRARTAPIVVVTGPRQSGKTTLVRTVFADKPYVNLEVPDLRARVLADPRGFLAEHPRGAVIDEVQRAPDLLSYLQADVDRGRQRGRWILTGSKNLLLASGVSQSLAGRAALLDLLPLSLPELRTAGWLAADLFSILFRGGYPAPLDRRQPPREWLADYVATYVERDVRQLLAIGDLLAFHTFVGLAASRTGQLLNLSQLGADAGVSHNTAKSWIAVLEASYLVARLPPFSRNLGKRLTKTPKLHFLDSGLVCHLLGIREPRELRAHPLRGAVFESWVVSEVLKAHHNAGVTPRMSFFRDTHGLEVDLLVERGGDLVGVEAKSGATVPVEAFAPLQSVAALLPELRELIVVHGGDDAWSSDRGRALPFSALDEVSWTQRPRAATRRGSSPRKRAR